ncbi:hypothetical protein DdX_15342 [Ditylenchus destructor]|uniref:Uncharacterized protein n=1 Tax=Ditylenchus destructor TaxID=166010 RepID=A0AAD4MQI5_9BILA|nr:hypothetical protein DdX_15342 [Ditylenchus destructor]
MGTNVNFLASSNAILCDIFDHFDLWVKCYRATLFDKASMKPSFAFIEFPHHGNQPKSVSFDPTRSTRNSGQPEMRYIGVQGLIFPTVPTPTVPNNRADKDILCALTFALSFRGAAH